MVLQEGYLGPFDMSEADREASKFDFPTGDTTTKKRRKDAMENNLKAKGVRARGSRNVIVRLCKQNDIPHKITTAKIKEGWGGKPKGVLQILWERGFIDPSIEPIKATDHYTNDEDAFGNLIAGTSL
jgi:hypothetical protein